MAGSPVKLESLGWDARWEEAFVKFRESNLAPARVATEDKHHYTVVGEPGECLAVIAGKMFHQRHSNAGFPKVGDWVAVAPQPGEAKVVIHHVLPRRTTVARKVPGREVEEQLLAVNVDKAFVVQALDTTFNLRRLERFLVMIREGGAEAVVILNKADLCDDVEARLAETQQAAGPAPVIVVSAKTRRGIGQLRERITPGQTVVFIGTSGVGKSSLINRLCGEEVQPTIEVRESDSKGRHSTTWRELIPLPCGGLVIDTPGMREFHMWMAGDGADEAFPDIAELAVRCHFRNCSHTTEKRCALKEAVEAGQLPRERMESFLKLQRELEYMTVERREHTYMARKRQTKISQNAYDQSRQRSGGWEERG